MEINNENMIDDTEADETVKMEAENIQNDYDQPASQEEIAVLREEIEKKIEDKAIELKISKERLIKLADLDLDSLNEEKLPLDLNRGSLAFIEESIDEAINEYWIDKKTKELVTAEPSIVDKILKFTREHKKHISLGELVIYLSSFGPAALKDLAGNNAEVEINGEKISLKDLADNPELINEVHFLSEAGNAKSISLEHFNVEFLFKVDTEINPDGNPEKYIYFDELTNHHIFDESNENIDFDKLEKDLAEIGVSLNEKNKGCSFDVFYENQNEIIDIISENLDIPKNKVEQYVKNIISMETSQISLVKWEDWEIDKDFNNEENVLKLKKEKEKISFKVLDSFEGTFEEKEQKIEEEWLKWGKENGYNDINKLLEEETIAYENSPIGKFNKLLEIEFKQVVESKKESGNHEEDAEFENRFLEKLNKSGYTIDELKIIAEENPKEVIEITAKIIAENVQYDWMQSLSMKKGFGKFIETKDHSAGIPEDTLREGLAICDGYAKTFAAAISLLREKGVPHLDKIAILQTDSGPMNHAWNTLININGVATSIDLTSADDENISKIPEKLNAVDKEHYVTHIKEKVNEAHQKVLDKIKDYNILSFQERLKEILTQYDPKFHKREQHIEGDKSLLKQLDQDKNFPEKYKNIELPRETRKNIVKNSSKDIRNKIKKIYAEKDSKGK